MPQSNFNFSPLENLQPIKDDEDVYGGVNPEAQLTTYYDEEGNPETIDFQTAFEPAVGNGKFNFSSLESLPGYKGENKYNFSTLDSLKPQTQYNYNSGSEEENWFLDALPDFLKAGYNQSITGLAHQLANGGTPAFDTMPEDLNAIEDVMATVFSFFMPADILAIAAGGGIGGLGARAAVTASSLRAIKALTQKKIYQGLSARAASFEATQIVEKATRIGMMKAKNAAASGVASGASALGFYSGIGAAANLAIQEGDFGEKGLGHAISAIGKRMGSDEAMTAMLHGAILGGVTGGTGKFLKRKGWTTSKRTAVEIAEFANLSTLLEKGEIAAPEDYLHAAGVIFGMKGVRLGGSKSLSGLRSVKSGLSNNIRKFIPDNRYIIKGGEKRVDIMKWRTKEGKEYESERDIPEGETLKSVHITDPVKGTSWWSESTKFFSKYESAKGFIGRMIEDRTEKTYQKILKKPLNEEERIDRDEIMGSINKGVAPPPGQFNRLLGYIERERQEKISELGLEEGMFKMDTDIKKLVDYREKLRKREVEYERGSIKKTSDEIRNLKKERKEIKNIIATSEKLGIKEYSPFKTPKIDISNKPDLVKTAAKAQERRKDLAESEEQWRKYRKDRFEKENLEDFNNEELAQYVSYLTTGKRRRQNVSSEVRKRYAEYVRAKEVMEDIENKSSYAKSLVSRTNSAFENNKRKGLLSRWKPTEEGVAALNDNYTYGLYIDILNTVKIADNVVHGAFIKEFNQRAFEIMGNKDPNNFRNTKFSQEIINYLDTGKAPNEKVKQIGDLVKEFDMAYAPMTRAARAMSYFRASGSTKGKILPIIPESDLKKAGIDIEFIRSEISKSHPKLKKETVERRANKKASVEFMKGLEKEYSKLLEKNTPDAAASLFIGRMGNYSFGVREKYLPQEYHRPIKNIVEEMLSPRKVGAPVSRLMRRRAEGVIDPNRFWGWFDNRLYKDHMVIFGTPRIENFVNKLNELNPRNMREVQPFIQSIYRYSDIASSGAMRKFQAASGMFYKAWLMSGYPSIRNLTQNVARSSWIPIENIDLFVKEFRKKSPKEQAFFDNYIDQMGGVEQTHYLTSTAFKDAPLPIRKYERAVNWISRHYSYSDKMNRTVLMHWLMPLQSHVKAFKAGRITDKQLFQRLKLEQSSNVVKNRLLNKLYNENVDNFMGEYIRQKMIDVHHLYTRYERPIFMQSETWRPLTGLLTYSVSSLAKINREFRLLKEGALSGEMPGFGKRQILQVMANQAGTALAKQLARQAAAWSGADIVSRLTDEDGEAYKKIKADDLYNTVQWMIPSTAANAMVEKITGKPGKYGFEEINIGMPLQAGVAQDFSDGIRFLIDWANNPEDEATLNRVITAIESTGTQMIPLMDFLLSGLSGFSGLLRGRLYDDFLPYATGKAKEGENIEERMRMMKLRFRDEMSQRYNYVPSEEFDKIELIYRKFIQMPFLRGERRPETLRQNAIGPLVQSIVLDDIASKVARFNPDEADKILRLSEELMQEYLDERKYVPRLPKTAQMGLPYIPGKETISEGMRKLYK
jgi:hypothetical protein